jgi:glutathione synthase/RimK-type ligase-like ATP-grasp enzyme
MILLLTHTQDTHADLVQTALKSLGAKCFRFDTDRITTDVGFEAFWDTHEWAGRIWRDTLTADFRDIHAVWWRRPVEPALTSIADAGTRRWARDESFVGYSSVLSALPAAFLSSPEAIHAASNKAKQLAVARSLGFLTPETLITHAPEKARTFFERHPSGGLAIKPFKSMRIVADDGVERVLYTSRVGRAELKTADDIATSLHQFQQYIEKNLEIRATVVAGRIFAAEIHSQACERTKVDWRNYDIPRTPHHIHELPTNVREQCLAIVRFFQLEFGAIDLVLTPRGEYVFLEINPNGQWEWIEVLTGLPITKALCERLIEMDRAERRLGG